jgi:tetratricopeptide (TPR) repeat protein
MATQPFLSCAACGARNKTTWEYCARCGEALGSEAVVEPAPEATAIAEEPVETAGGSGAFTWVVVGVALLAAGWWAMARRDEGPASNTAGSTVTAPSAARSVAPVPVEDGNLAKGRNLLAQGDAAQALAALAQAVAEAPNDPEARYAYAQALWQGADKGFAVGEYEAAARLAPRSFKYRSELARAYGATNRPAEAIVEYEAALAVQPDSPGVLREAANLHLQGGRPERAVPLLMRAVALAPDSAVLTQDLAHAAEKSGNEPQAVAAYRRVLEINPGAAVSRGLLAESLFRQGKKEDAITLLQDGIAQNPDAAILQRGLGSVLERSGRTQEAVAAYREYARLAPRASDAKQIRDRAARLEQRQAATAAPPPS